MDYNKLGILGGGLSGLAFLYFLGEEGTIIEKEDRVGGLCRSFKSQDVYFDIGPHIFFSKNKEALEFLRSLTPMHQRRRSNKIFYKGRFVKYPFENELSALPEKDRDWCLNTFLNNPYETYEATNMLTFFYKTFGEGITRAYLEPYNRKIWKFEPSFMDLQMVERIPKPPAEDIIKSAKGIPTEGYLHQLYFWYPNSGGTESMVRGLKSQIGNRLKVLTNTTVERLVVKNDSYKVHTNTGILDFERVVCAMPIHELVPNIEPKPPQDVIDALSALKFNSIHITVVHTTTDNLGNNFAVMVPNPEISFHRLSKIDFLGDAYKGNGYSTIMAEITFRKGDRFDLPDDTITEMVVSDLDKVGFVPKREVISAKTLTFKYAYVIYDLHHRKNTNKVLAYMQSIGIPCVGRFAAFEYINMDAAVWRAKDAAHKFKEGISS